MSAKFKVEIELSGSIFDPSDPTTCEAEIARILRKIADKVEEIGNDPGVKEIIRDVNGNRCGYWIETER